MTNLDPHVRKYIIHLLTQLFGDSQQREAILFEAYGHDPDLMNILPQVNTQGARKTFVPLLLHALDTFGPDREGMHPLWLLLKHIADEGFVGGEKQDFIYSLRTQLNARPHISAEAKGEFLSKDHVFVSYSSDDRPTVLRLIEDLRRDGISVWHDQSNLKPGDYDWEENLRHAITTCRALLLVASPNSRRSLYVRDEVQIAQSRKKRILPIWIHGDVWIDCVPLGMGFTQHIDSRGSRYDVAITELVQHLSSLFASKVADDVAPAAPEVMITYSRLAPIDAALARTLEAHLIESGYSVYVDDLKVMGGTDGANMTRDALSQSRYFIVLLSPDSVGRQLIQTQVEIALAQQHKTGLRILPVLVQYGGELQYQLRRLNDLPWAVWQSEQDTPALLNDITHALAGGNLSLTTPEAKQWARQSSANEEAPLTEQAPPPSADLTELASGTDEMENSFYVKRASDDAALNQVEQKGHSIVIIRAPYQMGKSTLLARVYAHAKYTGKAAALIDLRSFDEAHLQSLAAFVRQVCCVLANDLAHLGVPHINDLWDDDDSAIYQATSYMGRAVLPALAGQPLVLAIDELDWIYKRDFHRDFYAMLRGWFNTASHKPIWQKLSQFLVVSTEPTLLMENSKSSPFNVATHIHLTSFTFEQVAELNERYGLPFSQTELEHLYALVGGHPYLNRQAMHRVVTTGQNPRHILTGYWEEDSPFADHLQYYFYYLSEMPELREALLDILLRRQVPPENIMFRLRAAGLVRYNPHGNPVSQCRLYDHYYTRTLEQLGV
jgi:hypothetical protein